MLRDGDQSIVGERLKISKSSAEARFSSFVQCIDSGRETTDLDNVWPGEQRPRWSSEQMNSERCVTRWSRSYVCASFRFERR